MKSKCFELSPCWLGLLWNRIIFYTWTINRLFPHWRTQKLVCWGLCINILMFYVHNCISTYKTSNSLFCRYVVGSIFNFLTSKFKTCTLGTGPWNLNLRNRLPQKKNHIFWKLLTWHTCPQMVVGYSAWTRNATYIGSKYSYGRSIFCKN